MVVNLNSLIINTFFICGQICYMYVQYKSEVCLVLVVCTCELDINWSLFFVTNKSIESIYWDWTGKIFNSLNSCRQEAFLPELIIILLIFSEFWVCLHYENRPPEYNPIGYNRMHIREMCVSQHINGHKWLNRPNGITGLI
jgi:hypothetical protein